MCGMNCTCIEVRLKMHKCVFIRRRIYFFNEVRYISIVIIAREIKITDTCTYLNSTTSFRNIIMELLSQFRLGSSSSSKSQCESSVDESPLTHNNNDNKKEKKKKNRRENEQINTRIRTEGLGKSSSQPPRCTTTLQIKFILMLLNLYGED